MSQAQLYYQLTGYQTQIRWYVVFMTSSNLPLDFHARFSYDDKRLAESIAGRSSLLRSPSNPQAPVELILGIYTIIINIVQVFRCLNGS
jgi:hypothetical protein